jgi:hypothetical protein
MGLIWSHFSGLTHVIHVKSCHSCQIMSFMSNHVIHVKSCHSCQIMSFVIGTLIPGQNSLKSERGGVKCVFLGLWRQLRCQAEGKNTTAFPLPPCM